MTRAQPLGDKAQNIVTSAKDRAVLNNGRLLRAFLAAYRDDKALTLDQIAEAMEDNILVVELLVYLGANDLNAADDRLMEAAAAQRKQG